MRDRVLHDVFRGLALAAGKLLRDMGGGNGAVPFELEEGRGRGGTLYAYRPLTEAFIDSQLPRLEELDEFAAARTMLRAIGGGRLDGAGRGADGAAGVDGAHAAVVDFLKSLWSDDGGFSFDAAAFSRSYEELERAWLATGTLATVIAPLVGMRPVSGRMDLGGGIAIVPIGSVVGALRAMREAGESWSARTAVTLALDGDPRDVLPASVIRMRLRRVLLALRLYRDSPVSFAATAYVSRTIGGWRGLALSPGSGPAAESYVLTGADRAPVSAILEGITAGAMKGRLGWSVGRFTMGLDRMRRSDGLSDHLLALRGLLGDPASGRSEEEEEEVACGRLAALTAEPGEGAEVADAIRRAFAVERALMVGQADDAAALEIAASTVARRMRAVLAAATDATIGQDVAAVADGRRRVAAGGVFAGPAPAEVAAATTEPATFDLAVRDLPEPARVLGQPDLRPVPDDPPESALRRARRPPPAAHFIAMARGRCSS